MKKSVLKAFAFALFLTLILTLVLNFFIQRRMIHQKILNTSEGLFWQVSQLVQEKEAELERIKADFSAECLRRARMAAYILSSQPGLHEDLEELRRLSDLLLVDEIHLFTPEGEIYSGTHPEYYHYTFHSGEQMEFFLPMLDDHTMELCQEITPNTAEGKLMQYAAVWSEDESLLVQIGMNPQRVEDAIKGRDLASVFALLPMQTGTALYAVDPKSEEILASTKQGCVGQNARAYGLVSEAESEDAVLSHAVLDGEKFCVASCRSGSVLLVRTFGSSQLYQEIGMGTALLAVNLILISLISILVVLIYMDRRIVREITVINRELQEITSGVQCRLEHRSGVPELRELCGYVNDMLGVLHASYQKVSIALEYSQIPMGILEYSGPFSSGFATSRVRDILMLGDDGRDDAVSELSGRVEAVKREAPMVDRNIYQLTGADRAGYIRLEEFDYEQSHIVILMDVTRDWSAREQLRRQRDQDALTGLCNRRGFYERMDRLMEQPEELGFGALALIDADGLKLANDTFGHAWGDQYLCRIADILRFFPEDHAVSARLGGDEFVLFLHGYADMEELEQAVEALTGANGTRFVEGENGGKLDVWYSVGFTYYPREGRDYHSLLRLADERMYADKRARKENGSGRNGGK